jgi:hypothetical protein
MAIMDDVARSARDLPLVTEAQRYGNPLGPALSGGDPARPRRSTRSYAILRIRCPTRRLVRFERRSSGVDPN